MNDSLAERIAYALEAVGEEGTFASPVPAAERLPTEEGWYLVRVKEAEPDDSPWEVAGWDKDVKKWWGLVGSYFHPTITHWAPLPAPPKGDDR